MNLNIIKWTLLTGSFLLCILFYQCTILKNKSKEKQTHLSTERLNYLKQFTKKDTIFYNDSTIKQYADYSVININDSSELLCNQRFFKKSKKVKGLMMFMLENSIGEPQIMRKGDEKQFNNYECIYYSFVDIPPIFPGGEEALLKYISSKVRYPESAKYKNIQGKVQVQFVITKNGDVKNVSVVRKKSPKLDEEAIRVILSLPKWTPGYVGNTPVNVVMTIPINFHLSTYDK